MPAIEIGVVRNTFCVRKLSDFVMLVSKVTGYPLCTPIHSLGNYLVLGGGRCFFRSMICDGCLRLNDPRMSTSPGRRGNHRVKPRRSNVPASAAGTGTPRRLSIAVDQVSKLPSPIGIGASAATIDAPNMAMNAVL